MKFRNTVSLAAILAVSPTVALAEDAASDTDEGSIIVIGEVLYSDQINAVKTPTPIIDVPQSLSIVTLDQIEKRGFNSIGQIVDYTPGVNMSQGEGHRDSVVFRGIRSTADFYIDGMRDDVQYYRPLYNLEQVEILRGPNALLFGRGGTGGILNRVTKKPVLGENLTGFAAGVDTFGEFGLQIDQNVAFSDNVALRFNGMYESLDNHRDFYDGDRIGFNPTLRVKLSEATTFDLSYEYVDHERFIDRGIPTGSDGRPVEAFEDIVFGDAELNFTTLQAHLIRASLSHAFSDNVKANVSAFYGDYDKVYSNFYASFYDQAATPDRVTTDGYVDTTQRQNLILSGNLVGEFDTGGIDHTIVVGGEYIQTSSDQDRFNPEWSGNGNDDNEFFLIERPLNFRGGVGINFDGNPTTASFTDLNDDTSVDLDVFSFYIQDQIEITTWLDIVAGIRFDSFEISVLDRGTADPALRNLSRKDTEWSPRFGVILKPQENISIYGSYSKSFQPRSGEQFADIRSDSDRLAPNEFTNLEAGVKWDIKPDLSLTAAIFQNEQRSPQVADADPATLEVIESEVKGFEAQLQGQITDSWFVSAGYSYLDSEIQSRTGPTGLRPRELPEHMFSLWNNFQLSDIVGFGLGVTHQSSSFINNSNTAELPAYTRFDAALYIQASENIRLQVNFENITDELYFPNSHSTHQATVGAPINARFSIIGRF